MNRVSASFAATAVTSNPMTIQLSRTAIRKGGKDESSSGSSLAPMSTFPTRESKFLYFGFVGSCWTLTYTCINPYCRLLQHDRETFVFLYPWGYPNPPPPPPTHTHTHTHHLTPPHPSYLYSIPLSLCVCHCPRFSLLYLHSLLVRLGGNLSYTSSSNFRPSLG